MQETIDHAAQVSAEMVETEAGRQLAIIFKKGIRVTAHKPRWMPKRMYMYLMRTILIEVKDL